MSLHCCKYPHVRDSASVPREKRHALSLCTPYFDIPMHLIACLLSALGAKDTLFLVLLMFSRIDHVNNSCQSKNTTANQHNAVRQCVANLVFCAQIAEYIAHITPLLSTTGHLAVKAQRFTPDPRLLCQLCLRAFVACSHVCKTK